MIQEVLARKIARIADKLARIAEVSEAAGGAIMSERSSRDLAAFYLAMAIEDCINIAEHLIADRGWGAPDSASEGFRLLERHGVLSAELAVQMIQAAGMRNAILHQYDDLDWGRVAAALSDVSRLRQFIAAVRGFAGLG